MSEVVGTCQGITEKPNGWFEFEIAMPGKQYPLKLATKQEDIVAAARGVGQSIATWEFNEVESDKINPHNNKPYVNRYLEGVVTGATAEAQAASDASTAGGSDEKMTKADWDAKERRDFRSRAWAQTISAFTHTIKTDEATQDVYNRLKPFQTQIYLDIVGDLAITEEEMEGVPF